MRRVATTKEQDGDVGWEKEGVRARTAEGASIEKQGQCQ